MARSFFGDIFGVEAGHQIDRILDGLQQHTTWWTTAVVGGCRQLETKDGAVVYEIEAPGVTREGVSLKFLKQSGTVHVTTTRSGDIRTWKLEPGIATSADNVTAVIKDGLLTVTIKPVATEEDAVDIAVS